MGHISFWETNSHVAGREITQIYNKKNSVILSPLANYKSKNPLQSSQNSANRILSEMNYVHTFIYQVCVINWVIRLLTDDLSFLINCLRNIRRVFIPRKNSYLSNVWLHQYICWFFNLKLPHSRPVRRHISACAVIESAKPTTSQHLSAELTGVSLKIDRYLK
jgi:hypothetical protein